MIAPSSATLGKCPNSMYRPCTSSGGGEVDVERTNHTRKDPRRIFPFS